MKGYERSWQTKLELVDALEEALSRHPEQRLGQLLINLSRGKDMWLIYDEEWIELLEGQ